MTFTLTVDDDIELELLEDAHAEPLFNLVDDARAHLDEWMPWVEHTQQVEDSETFIRRTRAQFGNNTLVPTGIRHLGELCGHAGITIDGTTGELGYWIHPDWEGEGIVARSCRALTTYGFRWRDLHRIEIRTEPNNRRSAAVAERLDFTLEGTLRELHERDDRWVDLEVHSMLAEEWEPDR